MTIVADGTKGISRVEYDKINSWLAENQELLPIEISIIAFKLLNTYWSLFEKGGNALKILQRLREQMGFSPKSEKGTQVTPAPSGGSAPGEGSTAAQPVALDQSDGYDSKKVDEETLKRIADLEAKRADLLIGVRRYGLQIGAIKRAASMRALKASLAKMNACAPVKSDPRLEKPEEAVFTSPISTSSERDEKLRVDREQHFKGMKGMHSAYDKTDRYEVKTHITKINYKVETVTNPETGESVRASTEGEGPAGSNLTWGSIETLTKMHAGFALPIHRVSLMLGHAAFSAGKIYRSLEWTANLLLPLYLYYPEALSEVDILSGDDTTTQVIDQDDAPKAGFNIHKIVDDALRWKSGRADGKGDKKAVNVTLITGRTTTDPRSVIQFFRTHVGSFGNLVTRILEIRSPKNRSLIIQGDLSSSNKPEAWIREKFEIQYSGCGAHSRRPIWRYREDDPDFCYYLLQCYAHLAQVEQLIQIVGATEENFRKYRRYARLTWYAIRNRCLAAISGERPTPTTDSKHQIRQWPPKTYLYGAAKYIVDNFKELTLYLDEPRLPWTTNDQERGLRFEKCLLGAAKFKGNRNGRTVLDILRTELATCTTANVEVSDHLEWVYKNRDDLEANPQKYTPFAYALHLDELKKTEKPPAQNVEFANGARISPAI